MDHEADVNFFHTANYVNISLTGLRLRYALFTRHYRQLHNYANEVHIPANDCVHHVQVPGTR